MKKIIFFTLIILFSINFAYAEENQPICTMDAMQCPDGTWVGRSGPNCEFSCAPKPEDVCGNIYEPVCALPSMPECLLNHMCKMPQPGPTTYSNVCFAKKAKAEILHEGNCDELKKVDIEFENNYTKEEVVSMKDNKEKEFISDNSKNADENLILNQNFDDKIRIVNKIQTKKLFGVFSVRLKSKLIVDDQSGQLIKEKKPWYSFLFF